MKNIKGQIAIEYIILIAILLLFFQSVIYPNVTFSENMISDVYEITQTKQSMEKFGEDISSFSSTPGYGKRLFYLYLPKNASITSCNSAESTINYQIKISPQAPQPNIANCNRATNICTFSKILYISSSPITCENIGPGFNGYLVVEKTSNGSIDVKKSS